jgi:hypothetical protein
MVAMPGPFFYYLPWALEVETKEVELRANESEQAQVLALLEGLEVSDATQAIFQRYVNGELTIKELGYAIDEYLYLKPSPQGLTVPSNFHQHTISALPTNGHIAPPARASDPLRGRCLTWYGIVDVPARWQPSDCEGRCLVHLCDLQLGLAAFLGMYGRRRTKTGITLTASL